MERGTSAYNVLILKHTCKINMSEVLLCEIQLVMVHSTVA